MPVDGKPWRLLVLPPLPPHAIRGRFAGTDGLELIELRARDRPALLEALATADLVLGDWSGTLTMDAEAIAAAPHLAFVQQPSVGLETVDVDAATSAGIPVSNAGAANAVSVAEWCLTAALVLRRQAVVGDRRMRAGEWPQHSLKVRDLAEARVGLLGMGTVGRVTADRFAAMGCEVGYWSRSAKDVPYPRMEPADLAAWSDVLVCLLPGAPETAHLVDAALLDRLPAEALLISAGRGSVVDEDAVLAALRTGRLAGAGFDVYDVEPLPANSPLLAMPAVFLSPHAAGLSRAAMLALAATCRRNLSAAVAGQPVGEVVNGVDPLVRRR